jgi:hypothetical protein
MLKRAFAAAAVCAALVTVFDLSTAEAQAAPKYRYDQKIMADPPAGPPPLKKRMAVSRLDDSTTVEDSPFGTLDPTTQKKYQNDDINSPLAKDLAVIRNGFTERLITALFATDRFIVVERRDVHKILREQDFAKTDRMSRIGSIAQGEMLSSQYFVTGLITLDHGEGLDTTSDSEVEMRLNIPGSRFSTTLGSGRAAPTDGGSTEESAGATMGDRSLLGDIKFQCPRNPRVPPRFAFHMRVYDVSTSQIVSAVRVSADNQWCLIKAGVQRMVTQMEKFPWRTRVTAVEGDRIVVEGGRDVNMSHGYRLAHESPSARSAASPARPTSELEIIEVSDATSIASPIAATRNADIRAGDWVVQTTAPVR